MRSFRECPACRALLTDEQLARAPAALPLLRSEALVPRAIPATSPDARLRQSLCSSPGRSRPVSSRRWPFPAGLGGKIVMAGTLLIEQLPLFAALVLTIWLPGNLLLEMAIAAGPNQPDPATMIVARRPDSARSSRRSTPRASSPPWLRG